MDFERLRIFARVAELGSFSRAALLLGSTQSAVSKQISQLERELDTRLFHRTGRGVALTESGRALLPRAKTLLDDAERLRDEVGSARGVPTGVVRLAVLPSVSRPLVQRVFERTRSRFPAVRLHVLEGVMGQVDEWLAQGRADVALVNRFRRAADGTVERLFSPALYLVGRAGNPVTTRPTIPFARLAGLPLVLPSVSHGLRVVLEEAASKRGIRLATEMEVDSLSLIKDIVAATDSFSVAAYQAVSSELAERKLAVARIVQPTLEQAIVLVIRSGQPQSLAVQALAGIIREVARELVAAGVWRSSDEARPTKRGT